MKKAKEKAIQDIERASTFETSIEIVNIDNKNVKIPDHEENNITLTKPITKFVNKKVKSK